MAELFGMRKPGAGRAGGPSGAGGYFADLEDDLADLDLDDLADLDLDDLDDLDSKLGGFDGVGDGGDGGYMGNVVGRSRLQPPPLLVPSMMEPAQAVYVSGLDAGLPPSTLTRQVGLKGGSAVAWRTGPCCCC